MRGTASPASCLSPHLDEAGGVLYSRGTSVQVPMVDVREVGMLVRHGGVLVPVLVRLVAVPLEFMRMLMMRVVHMAVCVCLRLMPVLVFVALGQV